MSPRVADFVPTGRQQRIWVNLWLNREIVHSHLQGDSILECAVNEWDSAKKVSLLSEDVPSSLGLHSQSISPYQGILKYEREFLHRHMGIPVLQQEITTDFNCRWS